VLVKRDQESLKIYEGVFDSKTLKILTSLANKMYFKSLDFPISTGKEADVFRATTKDGFLAAKIYRIETSKFVKTMHQYIDGDSRFKDYRHSKRGIIKIWCQKEFRNLKDTYAKKLSVPKPIKFEENILLMEFLGKNGNAFQTLNKVRDADAGDAVNFMKNFVIKLWNRVKIVHADISEFNVVVGKKKFYMIDMGQAVSKGHPRAAFFLKRDVKNIGNYARKHNVEFNEDEVLKKCLK